MTRVLMSALPLAHVSQRAHSRITPIKPKTLGLADGFSAKQACLACKRKATASSTNPLTVRYYILLLHYLLHGQYFYAFHVLLHEVKRVLIFKTMFSLKCI